jgi:heat shock protein HslJ
LLLRQRHRKLRRQNRRCFLQKRGLGRFSQSDTGNGQRSGLSRRRALHAYGILITLRQILTLAGAAAAAMLLAAPVTAASPDAWMKIDKASEAACLKAANLGGATAGPPSRFSDKTGVDARVVTGTWPQPHMKGAKAKMLCLYNRKSKRVEVQELAEPVVKQALVVKDVWWRAEDIGGKGIVDNSEVSLMLGSDGKIGGKSGCNGYSANYQLTGEAIKVFPPMIGTKMMCPPALMNQEQAYRSLIETAQSVSVTPEGALVITSAGGATSRFMRK